MAEKISSQLRIDAVTFTKTKIIAEQELRSLNNQFEYFIKKGIEQYEAENGKIMSELFDNLLAEGQE